jgi:hypothetical protein
MEGVTEREMVKRYGTLYGAHESVTTSSAGTFADQVRVPMHFPTTCPSIFLHKLFVWCVELQPITHALLQVMIWSEAPMAFCGYLLTLRFTY